MPLTPLRRFDKDPRYQRAVAKLSEMTPDQRAIFNSMRQDTEFADAEMRRYMDLLSLGAFREKGRQELGLRKEAHAVDMRSREGLLDLKRNVFESQQRQAPFNHFLGLLNVGAAGFLGYGQFQLSNIRAERLKRLEDRYSAGVR